MPGSLTQDQVAAYGRDGILFPIPVMSEAEAAACVARIEALEAHWGGRIPKRRNQKLHMLAPWLNDIVRSPAVLDAVESLIGPDIICWNGGFFTKGAGDGSFISWHQDSTYWGLSHPNVVTAWIAFTPSTPQSGCMQVIPGTHTADQVAHRDTFAPGNLLSRGQEIAVEVDKSQAVDVVLRPGEMSLHHVRIFHGSEANNAPHRRIGYAIRYIPTYVRQVSGPRTTAFLVRGTDRYRHFDDEPVPQADFAPEAVAAYEQALDRLDKVLYAGADR
jgi:ectoine hydroxylase-related dioxygenase (phytanoyl-CoA dioxygenase family)